ncbi:MAG: lipocalin family protein [Alistipes sp.]|nr:lipocalin family protein [Alistipes sp.]
MNKNLFRTIVVAVIASAVIAVTACGRELSSMEGTVEEVATNTLTVRTVDGGIVTFITTDAVRDCRGGLKVGSPVGVSFAAEPVAGFGTAVRIEAPEEYNLLVGTWVQPNPADETEVQGFELFVRGEAESVNMHTRLVEEWSVCGRRLTLKGLSIGNGTECRFEERWCIEHLDSETLELRCGSHTERYSRADGLY